MCFGFLSTMKYAWITNFVTEYDETIHDKMREIRDPVFEGNLNVSKDNSLLHRAMIVSTGKWKSSKRNKKACALCLGPKFTSEYSLHGLCNNPYQSIKLYPRTESDNLYFQSHIDLIILQESKNWVIKSNSNVTFAILPANHDPIGIKTWDVLRIIGNCKFQSSIIPSPGDSQKRTLTLSACQSSEYTCGNGTCLPKEARCSHVEECSDGQDEVNCRFIVVQPGYGQSVAPPSSPLNLNINITLEKVNFRDSFCDLNVI